MFKRLQGAIVGVIIGSLLASGVAYAATKSLSATYNNIKIVIDGKTITPRDANGNIVEPFVVNGTTYLPVRAVADALGKEVYWDGPNYTVYLGRMDGKLESPTLRLGDAVNIGNTIYSRGAQTDNYGNRYAETYSYNYVWYGINTFETLLNMKYTKFKGTVFVPEGNSFGDSTSFTIEVDGRTVYTSPKITKTSAPIHLDINVTGGNIFKIITSSTNISIGDAGFYQ